MGSDLRAFQIGALLINRTIGRPAVGQRRSLGHLASGHDAVAAQATPPAAEAAVPANGGATAARVAVGEARVTVPAIGAAQAAVGVARAACTYDKVMRCSAPDVPYH